jgi:putative hydrolase of the HAD superfamily
MISAILFDMGGTLDSDGVHWLDRFYTLYTKLGIKDISKPQIKEAFYWADSQAEMAAAMKKAGLRQMMELHTRWQVQKLGATYVGLQTKLAEGFYKPAERIMRRNRHILEKLKHMGCKLGVISNAYGNVQTLCDEFGYSPYLDTVIDSNVVGVRKPDPAIFNLALKALNAPRDEVAFVGDSFERDIVPAKALGFQTFWLIGDQRLTPPSAGQADVVLLSLEDLPAEVANRRPKADVSA